MTGAGVSACKQLTDRTPVLPLRESATLQSIEAGACPGEGSQGARPAADFWRAYDAWKAKQPK